MCTPCHVGEAGLGGLLRAVTQPGGCASYAARCVSASTAAACGHVQLADALAVCAWGELPPQCYKHEKVGESFALYTSIVAVLYWLPLLYRVLSPK